VIQHEYDHLKGIFFTDHLKGLKKRLIMPALKKIMRGDVEANYKLAPGVLEKTNTELIKS